MADAARERVTAADLALWLERRGEDAGRRELERGVPCAMAPERLRHVPVETRTTTLLQRAVDDAGVECRVFGDGVSLPCADDTLYEPDALAHRGGDIDPDATSLDAPPIVVEVLSPSTAERDAGAKLAAYTALASVRRYPLLDPSRRLPVHHREASGTASIETSIRSGSRLALEPPGMPIDVSACFATLPDEG